MKMGFDIEGASPTAPDYRMLLAVLESRAPIGRVPAPPVADGRENAACSFSRAGIARLLGFEIGPHDDQGKDCLNLGGSIFGESGGSERSGQPGDGAVGDAKNVQGSHA